MKEPNLPPKPKLESEYRPGARNSEKSLGPGWVLNGLLGPTDPAHSMEWPMPRSCVDLDWSVFTKGREMCPQDALPRQKITMILGNKRISERILSDSPLFIVLQKPEPLNETSDPLK